MDDRIVKFRVGVMVVATMFLTGIMVLLFGDVQSYFRGYTIYIHFAEAPGVTDGTPIRKSGIRIGRVTKVNFAPQGGVIVEATINRDVELTHDEIPQVTGSLLGGDVVIQFVKRPPPAERPSAGPRDDTAAASKRAADSSKLTSVQQPADGKKDAGQTPPARKPGKVMPGEYIEGTVAPNALQAIGNLEGELGVAVQNLSTAGTEVGKLASSLNKLLADNNEQINRIVNKTEQSLDSLQRAMSIVEDVVGNDKSRDELKKSIAELPQLLSDTRSTVNTMQATLNSVDRNMRNLEGITGPLGERGDQMVRNVDQALGRLDGLLTEMSDFGRKLNSGEGSLGQLMRSPELYQHLNAAAANIDNLTRELKPILADARVFSDKIARHPELLGVRGAIHRSPGTK